VLTDSNNNLLAYVSYMQHEKLESILSMPGFDVYYLESYKMFPIFFNFHGESQLTMALAANDTTSFNLLLQAFIKHQSYPESAYLVNAWFMKAIRMSLCITGLLESPIIQTRLNASIIEHWDSWPEIHPTNDDYT
jgi:hypothetical protein